MKERKEMKYSIGLDIGIASVGWAVINLDKKRIEDLGVRLFSAAEKPKDGGPLNTERRMARGLRRRLRRRRIRMAKIKELFVKYNLLDKSEIDKLYILVQTDIDTWALRAEGLDRKLTNREWARVLTAIAKRRGYKSNRKAEEQTSDNKVLLNATRENKKYMELKQYRTIGEMFAKDEKYKCAKRNKSGEYDKCIDRSLLEDEIKILFEIQRKLGNEYTSKEFENEYIQVFNWQKVFLTEELMNKMIGKCTFEPNELRASKNSWTFERFMLLQKVNNLSYTNEGKEYYFTEEERKQIIELIYATKSGVKYTKIRKEINLPNEARFNMLNYWVSSKKKKAEELTDEEIVKSVEDSVFVILKGYHELKGAFEKANLLEEWKIISTNHKLLDEIAEALSRQKTDELIRESLKKLNLEDKCIECLLNVNFTKFGHLSYKAIEKILPYLEEGYKYDKATELAGYNFKNDDKDPKYKLPPIDSDEIRNPVVYRALTQTRKVINAIINRYGSPFEIHIEMSRDLTKNFKDRKNIEKKQNDNRVRNEEMKKDITNDFNISTPKPLDVLKKKLYHEQQGKSAYSLKPIEYSRLFEDGYVEIDHIIPFSRSFDDSYNNKVLVLSDENQNKRNKTPYEYLGEITIWETFEAWVNSTYRTNPRKKTNLLVKNYDEEKENSWISRNMNDTKYIARFMLNYIKKNLLFNDFGEKENRIKVKTLEGGVTTALRHYWGIPTKDRDKNDLHHATDAVIIAAANNEFINKIREYSKQNELCYKQDKDGNYYDSITKEKVDAKYKTHQMNRPWLNFTEEVLARTCDNPSEAIKIGNFANYSDIDINTIKPIFVSRMPRRKVSGPAHKETIYSKYNDEIVTVKKNLSQISKTEIEMIINDERCMKLYLSEKNIYDQIYEKMKQFEFKSEKAFTSEDVIKKKSKNGEGPIVRSIKVPCVMNTGVEVQNGLAANDSMVRVDVYTKDGKFYLVPIYVADMMKNELPNRAIIQAKPENEWDVMTEEYEFKFSLYYNDLIEVKKKKGEIIKGYYIGTHRGTAAITLKLHDGSADIDIGSKTLESIDKYEVGILGDYHKVTKEKKKGTMKNKEV